MAFFRNSQRPEPGSPTYDSVLGHLGLGPERKNDAASADAERFARLEAQIAEISAQNKALTEQNSALLSSTVRNTVPVNQSEPPKAPALDLSGLPDPMTDLEGYTKAMTERVNAFVSAREQALVTNIERNLTTQNAQQADLEGKADALWTAFDTKYGEKGWDSDLVEFAAAKVAQQAQAKGIDVQRYMFTTTDKYVDDVAKYLETIAPPKAGEGEGEGEPPDPNADPRSANPFENGRTAGVFGGTESGGKPAKGKDEPATDLVTDLQNVQRAMGFY